MTASIAARLGAADRRLEPAARALAAVSPLAVLERGYSITRTASGEVVTDPSLVAAGERITTIVRAGEIDSTVEGTRSVAPDDVVRKETGDGDA